MRLFHLFCGFQQLIVPIKCQTFWKRSRNCYLCVELYNGVKRNTSWKQTPIFRKHIYLIKWIRLLHFWCSPAWRWNLTRSQHQRQNDQFCPCNSLTRVPDLSLFTLDILMTFFEFLDNSPRHSKRAPAGLLLTVACWILKSETSI